MCAEAFLAEKLNLMFANFVHFMAWAMTRCFWVTEPSRKDTFRVLPSAHFFPASKAILNGAAMDDAPNSFLVRCTGGAFLLFSRTAACMARTFSVPVRMRSQHMWIGALRLRGDDLTLDLAMMTSPKCVSSQRSAASAGGDHATMTAMEGRGGRESSCLPVALSM